MIFNYLALPDLYQCMRVSYDWNEALNGDDPHLNETLFIRTRKPPLTTPLRLSITAMLVRTSSRQAAKRSYKLSLSAKCDNVTGAERLHPIIASLSSYLNIVNPHIQSHQPSQHRDPTYYIPVTVATQQPSSFSNAVKARLHDQIGGFDGGGWEDMLVSVPGARQVQVEVCWLGASVTVVLMVGNNRGVKVRDVVGALRRLIGEAERYLVEF